VKRPRSYKTACLVGAILAFGLVAVGGVGACSNQAEGERCETLNGNDDCNTGGGLICYPAALLVGTTSDRCCPQDRTTATAPVCKAPVSGVGDASAPPDTGPPPTDGATADAVVNEASVSDAPAEGG
jgi:hypothetical protein